MQQEIAAPSPVRKMVTAPAVLTEPSIPRPDSELLCQHEQAQGENEIPNHALFSANTAPLPPTPPLIKDIPGPNNSIIQFKYCRSCKFYRSPRASHCRVCDLCVDVHDHHCVWVNNCIGVGNYRAFLGMLISVMTLTLTLCGFALAYAILGWSTDSSNYGIGSLLTRRIVAIVMVVITAVVGWTFIGFFLFHLRISAANMTTHESIRKRAERYNIRILEKIESQSGVQPTEAELLARKITLENDWQYDNGVFENLRIVFCHPQQRRIDSSLASELTSIQIVQDN